MINTPLELRETLKPLLDGDLGTLMLPDEMGGFVSVEALWVAPPVIPKGTKHEGLQVVIDRYPRQVQPAKNKLNNQATELIGWMVTLTQFDISNEGMDKLDSVCRKIKEEFPNHRLLVLPLYSEIYPAIEFRLTFSRVFNCSTV